MYKTVRHGENSLQYTILPQTEEVLTNSGLKGKGRDYSPSIHIRRAKRKSTIKCVALVVFGLVVALALASVPLYVMHGVLFTRNGLQINNEKTATATPLLPIARDIGKTWKKILKSFPEPITLKSKDKPIIALTTTSTTTTSAPITQTATGLKEKSTIPPWSMPALRSWKTKSSSTAQPAMPMLGSHDDIPLITPPPNEPSTQPFARMLSTTANPQITTLNDIIRYHEGIHIRPKNAKTKIVQNELKFEGDFVTDKPTTEKVTDAASTERSLLQEIKDILLSEDDDDDFKNCIQVHEVFTLPPIDDDYPVLSNDEVIVSKTPTNSWYGARWPFVDTSSYFQWTGYSPSDNLLLPLLVSALSSIVLVLMLVFVIRRRKRNLMNTTNNTNSSTDTQLDDNTNLLTAENPEDQEEE